VTLTLDRPPFFDPALRDGLRDLLTWRRDVRAFRPDPLPEGAIERLIATACLAPSVGLSEPWRFVVVADASTRQAVRANYEACNAAALAAQDGSRRALYAKLKLAGLDQAPVHVAAFAEGDCEQGHGLGRQTMPTALDYSVAIAIHTLWLAARLEGIGLGWVSILDPDAVTATLDAPPSWRFIGYLCIGYPAEEHDVPALQRAGWDARRAPACRILYR
jgi:5,6-dimethylbenzimidazole synthase